ncbi:MAG: hydroxyacylglutathione hydrolase [Sphingobium sp.]
MAGKDKSGMTGVTVHQFPCLSDNYGFLLRDDASGDTACIDTPDAAAILRELDVTGWRLTAILNTHWHPDHAGGNEAVKAATGATIYAPAEVAAHFPIDAQVADGDRLRLGETEIEVMASGGHTLGHIVYHLPEPGLLFAGDTLFPMGCGRLFEGTAAQMWDSLSRIAALPRETVVYSAHEYTLANATFALSVDDSPVVAKRAAEVAQARARSEWTVPTTIGAERDSNPFLRAPGLALAAGAVDDAEAFGRVRAAKDGFKG